MVSANAPPDLEPSVLSPGKISWNRVMARWLSIDTDLYSPFMDVLVGLHSSLMSTQTYKMPNIYLHIYIHIYIYTYKYKYAYIHAYIHTYIMNYILYIIYNIWVCAQKIKNKIIQMPIYMYILYIFVCICIYVNICKYVCIYVCIQYTEILSNEICSSISPCR